MLFGKVWVYIWPDWMDRRRFGVIALSALGLALVEPKVLAKTLLSSTAVPAKVSGQGEQTDLQGSLPLPLSTAVGEPLPQLSDQNALIAVPAKVPGQALETSPQGSLPQQEPTSVVEPKPKLPDQNAQRLESREIAGSIIYNGPRDRGKYVALTFDADMTYGMEARLKDGEVKSWYNKAVVDILTATQTPATLFLAGLWIECYKDVARQLAASPLFQLGSHSYSHPAFEQPSYDMRLIAGDTEAKKSEIERAQRLLAEITGRYNRIFRFPGGSENESDLKILGDFGLTAIQWDVISGDARQPDASLIRGNVLAKTKPGSIVVMHMHGGADTPNAPATHLALPGIIQGLKDAGYSFLTIDQMLAL